MEVKTKTQPISKEQVLASWKRIKQGGKGMGIDHVSIAMIETNPRKYLYPLWNRLSSGSYFPPAVREVAIPKGDGKERILGIPTILDRVAQDVIKQELEKIAEPKFHPNSYGYRPCKSAHEAVTECAKNCRERWYVVDIDIKGFFDNIDHEQMMRVLRKQTDQSHILLYCERWLKASMQTKEGNLKERTKGSPQGGVISPLLENLYLDEAFDNWMKTTHPHIVFERYADDIVIHTRSMKQSQYILEQIKQRMKQYTLELSESKTKIVYCYQSALQGKEQQGIPVSFDFLGFTFKPRTCNGKYGKFLGYSPAISMKSQKKILTKCKELAFHNWVTIDIKALSQALRTRIRGWIEYYGKNRMSDMHRLFSKINRRIAKWILKKFKVATYGQAYVKMQRIARNQPNLFEHWKYGFRG
ncbi:MAG: group II intron reverse transcriptase/maturase [Ignavibacteriales bacterium]|nr:group II intron reverse transcriptase/maturase [Ignavibacteriales bacterium]